MKRYYAGINHYGVNVSYKSMGWSVKAFDTKNQRDNWVSKNWHNDQGICVAEVIDRRAVIDILGAGTWVEFDGFLINKKDDPRN